MEFKKFRSVKGSISGSGNEHAVTDLEYFANPSIFVNFVQLFAKNMPNNRLMPPPGLAVP